MAFSLSKLFGNKTSEIKFKSNDTVEAIISDVENNPYGVSENDVLYAGLNELGGYLMFQTVIVGQLHVKSKTGAELVFIGNGLELKLNSDMLEFESDHTDIKGRSITKIDFQVDKDELELLEHATLKQVKISIKNQEIVFNKYVISDEEE